MTQRDPARVLGGTVILLVVVATLLSTPTMIFARAVSVVDTELRADSGHAQRVLTKFDLGNNASLQKIPPELGNWTLSHTYEWDDVARLLNTNTMLSRDYSREDLFQPVNLLIVQSTNVSSFHPAPVCYQAQGWEVHDDGAVVQVPVPNATWSQAAWLSQDEPFTFQGTMNAKVLDVTKGSGKDAREHVALYAYLKTQDWQVTNDITWLRLEIEVPVGTGPEPVLPILSDLFAQAVPLLFTFQAGHEPTLGESIVAKLGPVLGWTTMGVAVAIPAGVVVLGLRGPKSAIEKTYR